MTTHNRPTTPTASVYCCPGLVGWVIRVTTGSYTFIGQLRNWSVSGATPMAISQIEVYKVNRAGIEMFTGYASERVKALLIPAMLTAAEECRRTGKYQAA